MKKLLIVLSVLFAFLVILVYLLIPSTLTITSSTIVNANDNSAERFVIDGSKWGKWWNYPNAYTRLPVSDHQGTLMAYGDSFKITNTLYKALQIQIQHQQTTLESKLLIVPLRIDSTGFEWKSTLPTSFNPYTRFMRYLEAKEIKRNITHSHSKSKNKS